MSYPDFLDDRKLQAKVWKTGNTSQKKIYHDEDITIEAKIHWNNNQFIQKIDFLIANMDANDKMYGLHDITYEENEIDDFNYVILHMHLNAQQSIWQKSFEFTTYQVSLLEKKVIGILFKEYPSLPTEATNSIHSLNDGAPDSKGGSIIIGS